MENASPSVSSESTCAICQAPARIDDLREQDERLLLCSRCGHRFTRMPREKQERYCEEYYAQEHKNWFDHPNYSLFEFILNTLEQTLGNEPIRVLDVGCGKGDFLRFLAQRRPDWILEGIDLNDNSHPSIRFLKGEFLDHDFGGAQYDVVTGLAVIEHIEDPHAAVRKMKSMVRPGGMLCLMTVDDGSLVYFLSRVFRKMGLRAAHDRFYFSHHLHHFSRNSLARLMTLNGCLPIRQKAHGFPLAAIDVPQTGALSGALYKMASYAIFITADIIGRQMLQTIIARTNGEMTE